jgi:VWFA-related protein
MRNSKELFATLCSAQSGITIFLYSLFVAIVLCLVPLYGADEGGYTIQTSASEVRLAFAVADRQGRIIKTLRSSDVAVADNGSIIRHFRSFRPSSESPLELVILVDASDSVASQIPSEITKVKTIIQQSHWGERDRVAILTFGGPQPMLLCARNCDGEALRLKLSTLHAAGATPLYDALFQAAEILKEGNDPETRPAMILISDGVDTISMHSLSDALEAAQDLQSAIYSVNCRSKKAASDNGDAILNYLAGSTGGLSFPPGRDVTEVLRIVLEDLRSGYVITYKLPEQSTGRHTVRVLPTSDPGLQFRSRQAYDYLGNE